MSSPPSTYVFGSQYGARSTPVNMRETLENMRGVPTKDVPGFRHLHILPFATQSQHGEHYPDVITVPF
ncbi:hypothetical protein BDZ89DRAFT_1150256 [Hymenopellis radicata]|nr:hypothetical protein BDZ89DRAFT_1150256 [Hymenopellis radicata]